MGLRDIDRDRTHGRPILNRVKTLVSARPLPSTEAGDGRGRLPPQSVRLDAAIIRVSKSRRRIGGYDIILRMQP